MIYILSLLLLILVSYLEAFFGINWDFHPDSVYYIENSVDIASGLNYENLANNLYYYIVYLLNSNITSLIILNSILYIATNGIIYNEYIRNNLKYTKIEILLITLIILNPYRAHLAIHILKDTLIIFVYILAAVGTLKFKLPAFVLIILLRIGSIVYFLAFIFRKMNAKLIIFIITLIFIYLYQNYANGSFNLQEVDMKFRDFDNIPNFMDQGFIGAILRFITWPLLLISGGFILFMPNILVLPIALSLVLIQIWSIVKFNRLYFNFSIIVTIGVFAFLVTGFTSFIRYTLPIITLIPIFINNKKNV